MATPTKSIKAEPINVPMVITIDLSDANDDNDEIITNTIAPTSSGSLIGCKWTITVSVLLWRFPDQ